MNRLIHAPLFKTTWLSTVAKTTALTFLALIIATLANGQKIKIAKNRHEPNIMLQEGPFYLMIDSKGRLVSIEPKIFQTENICIYYDVNGRIKRLGSTSVAYDSDGRIRQIGEARIHYDLEGRIRQVGKHRIDYDIRGRIRHVGSKHVD